MKLTELSTEYFLGEAAASVASMVATPLKYMVGAWKPQATGPEHLLLNKLSAICKPEVTLWSLDKVTIYIILLCVSVASNCCSMLAYS